MLAHCTRIKKILGYLGGDLGVTTYYIYDKEGK
jgi:hypothetical protein